MKRYRPTIAVSSQNPIGRGQKPISRRWHGWEVRSASGSIKAVLSCDVSHTTGDGHDELNRRLMDSWRKVLSLETSSRGKGVNDNVQTLVGFFCGMYGLILGCVDMDNQVDTVWNELTPQAGLGSVLVHHWPQYRHAKSETAQACLRSIRAPSHISITMSYPMVSTRLCPGLSTLHRAHRK
jgi:hypothetical protein